MLRVLGAAQGKRPLSLQQPTHVQTVPTTLLGHIARDGRKKGPSSPARGVARKIHSEL